MLDAQSIDLHYGAAQALRAVSLKAAPGKVTCVLGRNGVGKTSLLDALAGQQPVDSRHNHLGGQRYHRPAAARPRTAQDCLRAARP